MTYSTGKEKSTRDNGASPDTKAVGRVSFSAAIVLGGLGLLAAYEYGMVHDGELRLFWRQGLFLAAGLVLASALAFAPRVQGLPRFRQHAVWVAFALGILLFLAGQTPGIVLEIGGLQRWIQLFGFRINTALWAGLVLLPGMVHFVAQQLTAKRLLALAATLLYVNISLINTRNTPALFWFNGAVGVMLLATLHPLFQPDGVPSRVQRNLRVGLLVSVASFATSPLFMHGFRVKQLFLAWMPQCQEKHDHLYFAWAAHQNFIDGGLWGSGEPFTASRLIASKAVVSDFVLQVVGYRFGALGVLAVIALCLWLAWLWLRHAFCATAPHQRLWRLGLAAFLLLHIFGSIARTTALIPIVPPIPFPFMACGGNITLWSFICLGLLLRNPEPDERQTAKEAQCT